MLKRINVSGLYGIIVVLSLVSSPALTQGPTPAPDRQTVVTTKEPLPPPDPSTEVQNPETTKEPLPSPGPSTEVQNPETTKEPLPPPGQSTEVQIPETTKEPLPPPDSSTEAKNSETTEKPLPPPDPVTESKNPETRLTTTEGPTDNRPRPTDEVGPTDNPISGPTDGTPRPTDEVGPTGNPKPGPTDDTPRPTDEVGPTGNPKPGPTDDTPRPTDEVGPTGNPKPGPTDDTPRPTDEVGPTGNPKPGPTDDTPRPTDEVGPTGNPKPGPTDDTPRPTNEVETTGNPITGPTDDRTKLTDEVGPTGNPISGPTDDKTESTDIPRTSGNPLPTGSPAPTCGQVPGIEFGIIILGETKDPSLRISADVVCDKGYTATKKTLDCLESGEWENAECFVTDCGPLQPPSDGYVEIQEGTTYNASAIYSCTDGFSLVGDLQRKCLATGNWNGLTPDCVKEVEKITTCPEDVDTKGRVWAEVLVGKIRVKECQEGFTGNITRRCKQNGRWEPPKNNCVRKSIQNVEENVATLGSNSSEDDVNEILKNIKDVTKPNETFTEEEFLTDGELDVLAASLEKVVETVLNTNISSDLLSENITDDVIESASNLIDDANKESWKILTKTDRRGGEKVLTAVDSIGDAFCPTLQNSGKQKKTVVKRNVAFEVRKASDDDVLFPNTDDIQETEDDEWLRTGKSNIQLKSASLQGKASPCSITTVMYRNLSEVLSTQTTAGSESSDDVEQSSERINAPILAMSISPPVSGKIDPPVTITFEHADSTLTDPVCAFWQFQNDSQGYWSSEGCIVSFTNENYTICECDHLTNFAILMSPFSEADSSSQALRIISIIGISVSIICLLVTCVVHLCLWKRVRNDRTTRLMNLCTALLLSYIIFLAGVDRTESSIACAAIAAVLQYIYLVVFSIMLVEGVEIAVTLLVVFKTKSRTKLLLILAWVIPAMIVGISLGVTKLNGYGTENFCWLSVSNGVIWAFVGPALVIIFFNIICLFIVIRTMFQLTAVKNKKTSEKVRTSLWSLCVLVPITGISWILGIFYVNDSFYFIQYIFAILNGLQGFFIFLFHCLLNKQVKNAYKLHARKKSATYFSTNPTSKDERNTKSKENISSAEDASTRDIRNDWKHEILQESFPQSQVQYGSSLGMFNKGSMRKSAPFSSQSRDQLISDSSMS